MRLFSFIFVTLFKYFVETLISKAFFATRMFVLDTFNHSTCILFFCVWWWLKFQTSVATGAFELTEYLCAKLLTANLDAALYHGVELGRADLVLSNLPSQKS